VDKDLVAKNREVLFWQLAAVAMVLFAATMRSLS
jgi:hypothetical protein